MRHAKHSKPVRVAQIALALLVALAASSAAAQASAQPRAPAAAGPSYGPVLNPQPDQTPQAQEERAGAPLQDRHLEVDPSARPAPQPAKPAEPDAKKPAKKQAARMPRRSVEARIVSVPEVLPSRPLPLAAPPPAQPAPGNAGPVQINSCLGGACTDTAGGTYNTGVGNAAVNSAGRLCTRSGNTMQCF